MSCLVSAASQAASKSLVGLFLCSGCRLEVPRTVRLLRNGGSGTSGSRGRVLVKKSSPRSHGGLGGHHSGSARVLLDKFVKFLRHDGSLVARSPFSLKIRGSYFKDCTLVDKEKNKRMTTLYRKQDYIEWPQQSTSPHEIEHIMPAAPLKTQMELSKLASLVSEHIKSKAAVEVEHAQDNAKDILNGFAFRQASPVHVLLYGRTLHRIDTYSVVNSKQQQQSYVYLTDAGSLEEADAMFDQDYYSSLGEEVHSSVTQATAHISLWNPKRAQNNEDLFASAIKLFCPRHVVEAQDSGIRAVCLVPTSTKKVFLQADRAAHLDLDGTLIYDLYKVGLTTEVGNVRLRDVTAEEIGLSSRLGDLIIDGHNDGRISAETSGDGDVMIRSGSLVGSSLAVATEDGDIGINADLRSNNVYLATKRGNIGIAEVNGAKVNLVVAEEGDVCLNLISGCVTASVGRGDFVATVHNLEKNSSIHVEEGNIHVSIPAKSSSLFKLEARAPLTEVAPRLLNAGEMRLSKDGLEEFSSECDLKNMPKLEVTVKKGTVTVTMIKKDEEQPVEQYGYDSADQTDQKPY